MEASVIYGQNRRYLYLGDPIQLTLSPQSVEASLDRMQRARITDLLVIATNGRGGIWYQPTAIVPDSQSDQSWDAIAYWISRAHRLGMRCHAWFPVANKQPTFNVYPQYAPPGTPTGKWNIWLPATRVWLGGILDEVVSRYDWDGVHLDYVRTGGLWTGPDAAALYATETGRDFAADSAIWPTSPNNVNGGIQITNWMVQQASVTLRALTQYTRNLEVSTFGIGYYTEYAQGRRINEWLADGRTHLAFSSHYGESPDFTMIQRAYAGFTDGVVVPPVGRGQRMGVAFSLYKDDLSGPMAGEQLWRNLQRHRTLYPFADQALYVYRGGANVYLSDDQITWLSRA